MIAPDAVVKIPVIVQSAVNPSNDFRTELLNCLCLQILKREPG